MATIVNQVTSSALRGQGVIVTASAAEQSKLASLVVGTTVCTVNDSSNQGIVASVDTKGLTFEVTPISPAGRFDGLTAGILSSGLTIFF